MFTKSGTTMLVSDGVFIMVVDDNATTAILGESTRTETTWHCDKFGHSFLSADACYEDRVAKTIEDYCSYDDVVVPRHRISDLIGTQPSIRH